MAKKAKTKTGGLAVKINLSTLQYDRTARSNVDKTIVTFSPAGKTLFFNPKMVNLLNISNWKQAVVGYDRSSGIVVLKKCDVEEFGGVPIRVPPIGNRKHTVRVTKCRNDKHFTFDEISSRFNYHKILQS